MANHYILEGGSGDGSSWSSPWDDLPSTLARGDTYYIGDGNYSAYTFDDAESGTSVITIKKATAADHGTETGWSSSYGDGQAVFASYLAFTTDYYVIDGNGTHTIPSNDPDDYGIYVHNTATENHAGVLRPYTGADHNTIRYVYAKNDYGAKQGNYDTTLLRLWSAPTYLKVQNCFLDNSGADGIQFNASNHVLVERCYIKWLGELHAHTPDYHGQAMQIYMGADDIVIRYNVFESCEGQALLSIFGSGSVERIRFYGNVVYNPYGYTTNAGFNTSSGFIGSWSEGESVNGVYIYNNTMVNIAGDYDTGGSYRCSSWIFFAGCTNIYGYNNIQYNCEDCTVSGFDGYGYHASGGGDSAGGTNEQTGLASSIFDDYTGNDFRLTGHTTAGLDLTAQGWWDDDSDSFFGQVDYAVDMYGNTRSNWDRGAYEYGIAVSIEQEGFRFRRNDGDEDEATWYASQDENVQRNVGERFRLRFLLNSTGDVSAKNFQLEVKKEAGGTYRKVE
jgi:hypothetical protein